MCHNGAPEWKGNNAQAVAALHSDKHGHQTWVRINMTIFYGEVTEDPRQRRLFRR